MRQLVHLHLTFLSFQFLLNHKTAISSWRSKSPISRLVLEINNRMIICCKGCAKCCDDCCKCLDKSCGQCCNAINECFKTPFSLCAFLTFLGVLVPSVVGAFMLLNKEDVGLYCKKPIGVHLIVMAGCNVLNFFFALYLFCKFRKPYEKPNEGNQGQNMNSSTLYDAPKETNVWQRMNKVLCYDFVTLFYMLILIFEFIWACLGHSWLGESGQICADFCPTTVKWDIVVLVIFWVFLGLGLIVGLTTLCIQACSEGSCTLDACCCGCIYCCTCGLCGKSSLTRSNSRRMQNVLFSYPATISECKLWVDRNSEKILRLWVWSCHHGPAEPCTNKLDEPAARAISR